MPSVCGSDTEGLCGHSQDEGQRPDLQQRRRRGRASERLPATSKRTKSAPALGPSSPRLSRSRASKSAMEVPHVEGAREAFPLLVPVVGGLSAELLCTLEIHPDVHGGISTTLREVKTLIAGQLGRDAPARSQRLLGCRTGRLLSDEELLCDVTAEEGPGAGLCLMRADPEWCQLLEDLREGRVELEDVADLRWRHDVEVATAAVQADGAALEWVGEALQDDRSLVLKAVRDSGSALRHTSRRLQADREVVQEAVTGFGLALEHAAEALKSDVEIALAAVRSDQAALTHVSLDLKARKDFALAVVQGDGSALRHLPEEVKQDADVVLAAIRNHPSALLCCSEVLQVNQDFVLAAMKVNGFALRYALPEMKRNTRVVLAATIQNTHAFWYGSPELRHDYRFVQAAQRLSRYTQAKRGVLTFSDGEQCRHPEHVTAGGDSSSSACGAEPAAPSLAEDQDLADEVLWKRVCEELEHGLPALEKYGGAPLARFDAQGSEGADAGPGPPGEILEYIGLEDSDIGACVAELQATSRLLSFTVLKASRSLDANAWARLFAAVPASVEVINIQCSPSLGDAGVSELAKLFAAGHFTNLLTLWLLSNTASDSDETWTALAKSLCPMQCPRLREVWIFDNLSEDHIKLFRERLPHCDLEFDDLEFVEDEATTNGW